MIRNIIMCLALIFITVGCSKGTAGLWESANPQSSISVNPLTRSISVFSNDGKTFEVEEMAMQWSEFGTFSLKNFKMFDRSVENREANVPQLEMQDRINRGNWEGMKNLAEASIGAAVKGIVSVLTQGVTVEGTTPLGDGSITVGGDNETP